MGRCIIVGGLPYLSRTARTAVAKQIRSTIRNALSKLRDDTSALDGRRYGNSFVVEVSTNHHQRLDDTVTVVFDEREGIDDHVSALCTLLQQSASDNVITVGIRENDGTRGRDVSFSAFFSLGAGSIRDRAFPSMPWQLRRQIQCDGVGAFSLTQERHARRMAKLLRCFLFSNNQARNIEKETLVIDGMAGVGGNTLGFLKYWNHVISLEIEPRRASMLETNIHLWQQWQAEQREQATSNKTIRVLNVCLVDFLVSFAETPDYSVLFLDPPWSGPQYKEKVEEQGGEIVMSGSELCGNHGQSSCKIVNCTMEWKFSQALCQIVLSSTIQIVATKVPTVFDETALVVQPLVHDHSATMERVHPFRFHFGANTMLLVLVRNTGQDPLFANGPMGLDRMIRNIMLWHNSMDLQSDDGCREHRPEFYDWEKKRWIMLKKWKGSQRSVEVTECC